MIAGKTAETRIFIPDGMRKAFHFAENHDGLKWDDAALDRMLAAALRWLSENPIVPTTAQEQHLINKWHDERGDFPTYDEAVRHTAVEFQRIMFAAPEPEPMHPVLAEWMADADAKGVDKATKCNYRRLFDRAFQAGRESNAQGNAAPEVDRVDYYRLTPDGYYVPIGGPVDTNPDVVNEVAESVRPFADVLFKKSPVQDRLEEDTALKSLLISQDDEHEGYYRPSEFNRRLREAYRMGKESAVQK